ncbi:MULTISPECIES: hypothetical protein [unclassified Crossiella]|uniref:hypothetical protein n=1 Tax=unclassified Crossiella TaxID=2620835 RepID=UPI001FFFAC35|nr:MULTISPECIES: hypothetical protein [unclassified Crossiella]MCK2244389.1 hypothetical protein [Crossiella sp. S99.2]MCK2257783.1 hypothetical protein [Crossiella sp. S99.1]
MNRTRRRIPLRILLPGLLVLALLCGSRGPEDAGAARLSPVVLVLPGGVPRMLVPLLWFLLRERD